MKLLAHFSTRSLAATAASVLVLSSSVCGQSPPPLASDKPAERQLNMLVLGDSIMWGQGLDDESKFSRKVQFAADHVVIWVSGVKTGVNLNEGLRVDSPKKDDKGEESKTKAEFYLSGNVVISGN